MAYTVKETVWKKEDLPLLPEGNQMVEIKRAFYKTFEKEHNNVKYQAPMISMVLTSVDGLTEAWDNVWSNFNEDTQSFELNELTMDSISKAVAIPVGTNFNTIEEWIETITGKIMFVEVVHYERNGAPRVKIKERISIDDGVEFA